MVTVYGFGFRYGGPGLRLIDDSGLKLSSVHPCLMLDFGCIPGSEVIKRFNVQLKWAWNLNC